MPIHDQGYRRYGGERRPRGQAWAVIAKTGVRTFLSRRALLGLLLLAWFPFFVRVVQIYAAASVPAFLIRGDGNAGIGTQAAAVLAVTPETFRDFIGHGLQRLF